MKAQRATLEFKNKLVKYRCETTLRSRRLHVGYGSIRIHTASECDVVISALPVPVPDTGIDVPDPSPVTRKLIVFCHVYLHAVKKKIAKQHHRAIFRLMLRKGATSPCGYLRRTKRKNPAILNIHILFVTRRWKSDIED